MKNCMKKRIVVSSYDMISPLGKDTQETFQNAVAGKTGVQKIKRFDSSDIDVHYAGQVPEIDFLEYDIFTKRELKNWFSPVISHSLLTAYRAINQSGLEITDENRHKIAVTYSSAIGGLDAILYADQQLNAKNALPHPFTNVNVCLNLIAGKISMTFKTTGPIFSPVAACSTGNVSVTTGAMLIEQGLADIVICGAVDFPLVKSIVASFSSMNGAYNTAKPDDRGQNDASQISRPFSVDRKGFVISEGAACLVLTSFDYAKKHNMSIEAEILGYAMNSDGSHYVLPKTETCAYCINDAITVSGIDATEIDQINAHGTSTKVGDKNEISALKSVFGDKFDEIPISANKCLFGHSMGAASAIELIFSILSIKENVIYPIPNYLSDPDFELKNVFLKAEEKETRKVLTNSFGFGGTNCCIVLSEI